MQQKLEMCALRDAAAEKLGPLVVSMIQPGLACSESGRSLKALLELVLVGELGGRAPPLVYAAKRRRPGESGLDEGEMRWIPIPACRPFFPSELIRMKYSEFRSSVVILHHDAVQVAVPHSSFCVVTRRPGA